MNNKDEILTNWLLANADIKLEILPVDLSIRGNAICSGDDAFDKQIEDELIQRLDNGDELAWFMAKVSATFAGQTGIAYLGGCSYESIEQFKSDGYYSDMKLEAIANLKTKLDVMTIEINKMKGAVLS